MAGRRTFALALLVTLWLPGSALAQPQEPFEWLGTPATFGELFITPDARFVAWTGNGSPPGSMTNIVVYDRRGDRTLGLTLPTPSPRALPATLYGITGDGSTVLLRTGETLLFDTDFFNCTAPVEDCNFSDDLYLAPVAGGAVTRVSLTDAGDEAPSSSVFGGVMSDDGTRIAMVVDGFDPTDTNGFHEIYLRDLRATPPTTRRITLSTTGGDPNGELSDAIAISPDGNFIAFASLASDLVPFDTNGTWDVFVANAETGSIERVSVTTDGDEVAEPSGGPGLNPAQVSMSYDGRLIAFTSASNVLAPGDRSSTIDIFLHDRETHETTLATSNPACPMRGGGSGSPSLSWNGELLAFITFDECFSVNASEHQAAMIDLRTHASTTLSVPLDGSMREGPTDYVAIAGLGERVAFSSDGHGDGGHLSADVPDDARWLRYTYTAVPFRDRDGDGLYDDWEDFGIDIGNDGTVDLPLPALGARSDHHDLFVEMDWLVARDHTHLPSAVARAQVTDAFRRAPVSNPDGDTGVHVHFLLSDPITETVDNMESDALDGVRALRETYFGDAGDRGAASTDRLTARRLVFRYLVAGHLQVGTTSSGLAELPGDEVLLSLGGFADQIGTVDQQAGTLMHELGHSLGLDHGGVDGFNCKPNYLSVMSYTFQFPDLVPGRALDYGRALPELREEHLDETVGIRGLAGTTTVYGIASASGRRHRSASGAGPIDWNGDGDTTDVDVDADINDLGFGGCEASLFIEPLVAEDDWPLIVYDLRRTRGYRNGAGTEPSEITREIYDAMLASPLAGTNVPPTAEIGPATTIDEEAVVTLDATGSNDPEGAPLIYVWAQAFGPEGALSATDVLMPTFTAPRVDGDTTVVVELAVSDGQLFSVPRFQTITVRDLGGPPADAGTPTDAGEPVDAGPDATVGPGGSRSGCLCRAHQGETRAGGVLTFLVLVLAARRSRGRRRA